MLGKLFKSRSSKSSEGNSSDGEILGARDYLSSTDDPLLQNLDFSRVRLVPRDAHRISRKHISPNALKILYKLDAEGYQAFLVGGSVRDLLLDNRPKDFDIATSATPEDLKRLFRNARIIGRRFKIIHIRFGREIIEVTTFRAHHSPDDVEQQTSRKQLKHLDSARSSSGMILRDNVYGDVNEDAMRRDFTVNALYYTIRDFVLLDFAGGLDDIERKLIRMLGDPEQRFREDPVRMLRAIRFSAKLQFDIEPETAAPLDRLGDMLESVAPARLFDETIKLLSTGFGERAFELLLEHNLAPHLFPATAACIAADAAGPEVKLVSLALRNTDSRIAEDKSVTPAFLFAALLWPVLGKRLRDAGTDGQPNLQELQQKADRVIADQVQYTAIPKRFSLVAREIWELQSRLQRRNKRGVLGAFNHPRFRAAYDFLLLRAESGEPVEEIAKWWTDFQDGDTDHQNQMIAALTGGQRQRRRPRKRRKSDNR